MSVPLTTWAWSCELPVNEKLLLLALADCCHARQRSHTCWPSRKRLETMTGFSRSTLKRTLRSLEQRALIQCTPGQGRVNSTYRLACTDSPNHSLDLDDPLAPSTNRKRSATARGSRSEPAEGPTATPPDPPGGVTAMDPPPPAGGVTAADPQRGQLGPERVHSSDPRNRKRTGKEREAESSAAPARPEPMPPRTTATSTSTSAPCSLSQQPPVAWLAIAEQVRPDLRDPRRVFDKFVAYQGEDVHQPAEWERRWRLWLSREREPLAGSRPAPSSNPGASSGAGGHWGSFLDPPAGAPLAATDLTTDFEVIHHDR
ncbi:MAG: hypothetical protein GVY22_13645 [Gammaproteobacteria bacterium]|jgi:hypothetical protein|nr:hypothetical protein [Gammaproteobacteria bacterium]